MLYTKDKIRYDLLDHRREIIINDKFLFIQIPKNGSSSILKSCREKKLTKKINCFKHEGVDYLSKINDLSKIDVLTTIRNPFSRLVSFHLHHNKNIKIKESIKIFKIDVKKLFKNKNWGEFYFSQIEYLKINNTYKENIKKYKIEKGMCKIIEEINENYKIELKPNNINKHVEEYDFRDFYDSSTIDFVINEFEEEFVKLNYSMKIK